MLTGLVKDSALLPHVGKVKPIVSFLSWLSWPRGRSQLHHLVRKVTPLLQRAAASVGSAKRQRVLHYFTVTFLIGEKIPNEQQHCVIPYLSGGLGAAFRAVPGTFTGSWAS